MHRSILAACTAAAFLAASAATAAPVLIDFSDQIASFVTPTANPLTYPDVAFSSANGMRIFTFAGSVPLDKALCPHATNACRSAVTLDFSAAVDNISFGVFQVDERDSVLTITGLGSGGAFNRQIALTRGFAVNTIDLSDLAGVTKLTLDGTSDEEGVLYDNFRFEVAASGPGGPGGGGPAPVPEPTAWALMLAGFGLVGGALRTARRAAALA